MADDNARKYSKRNRRYQESMDDICAAGFTEINKGYVPTKAELAKLSGVSRETGYNHFKKTKAWFKVCANWPVRRYRKYMKSHLAWKYYFK